MRRFADEDLVELRGELLSVRVVGSDFFAIGQLKTATGSGKQVTIVGKLLGAKVGDTLELRGAWTTHAKFGEQFKVRECAVVVAADASGAIRWLAERLPGVGLGRATALVERFGVPGIWDVIEREPARLTEIKGLSESVARAIAVAYAELRAERERMVRFKGWGLTDAQIGRILAKWGKDAEERLAENPYLLTEDVAGFGFRRADDLARRMGLPADAPSRIRAALVYVLADARGAGHVYLRAPALVGIAAGNDILGGVDTKLVWRELAALERDVGSVVLHGRDEPRGARAYLSDLDRAEAAFAAFVRKAAA